MTSARPDPGTWLCDFDSRAWNLISAGRLALGFRAREELPRRLVAGQQQRELSMDRLRHPHSRRRSVHSALDPFSPTALLSGEPCFPFHFTSARSLRNGPKAP